MGANVVLVLAGTSEPELALLEPLKTDHTVVCGNSPAIFDDWVADANVILYWSGTRDLLRNVFLRSPRLQWIHSRWAGMDATLFPELIASPVPLTNGTGVFSPSLGEFALGAILYFAKDFRRLIRNQMAGVWQEFDVHAIEGQTVGIVGYGDIGREVAKRAKAMGMRVLALKRHVTPQTTDPLVEQFFTPAQLCEMMARCDYVVASAPLTPETHHLIGEREIGAMKPDAVILNIGRGPVIQERALLPALVEGRIKGAALDVFEQEPLPPGHPFYSLENVLLSPHSADHTVDWKLNAMRFFLEQFARFERGEPLQNLVKKHLGY
jgi:phosphoglycerate dehydrogenase-like enzyme